MPFHFDLTELFLSLSAISLVPLEIFATSTSSASQVTNNVSSSASKISPVTITLNRLFEIDLILQRIRHVLCKGKGFLSCTLKLIVVAVGANSVVTGELPDHCVAVGSPARVIKKYTQNDGWIKLDREI